MGIYRKSIEICPYKQLQEAGYPQKKELCKLFGHISVYVMNMPQKQTVFWYINCKKLYMPK